MTLLLPYNRYFKIGFNNFFCWKHTTWFTSADHLLWSYLVIINYFVSWVLSSVQLMELIWIRQKKCAVSGGWLTAIPGDPASKKKFLLFCRNFRQNPFMVYPSAYSTLLEMGKKMGKSDFCSSATPNLLFSREAEPHWRNYDRPSKRTNCHQFSPQKVYRSVHHWTYKKQKYTILWGCPPSQWQSKVISQWNAHSGFL